MLLATSPLRKVRMPVSRLPTSERSSSGTEEFSISPRIVSSSSRGGPGVEPMRYLSRPMSAFSQSMGAGKMTVEFFSAAISVRV
jgi:hypothetical protein